MSRRLYSGITRLVAELFLWTGSPIELDVLVNVVPALLEIKDQPHESVDDESNAYLEARVADSTLSSSSRQEQALRSPLSFCKHFPLPMGARILY